MANPNQDNLKFIKELRIEQEKLNSELATASTYDEKKIVLGKVILNNKILEHEQERLMLEARKENSSLTKEEKKELETILALNKSINTQLKQEADNRQKIADSIKRVNSGLEKTWEYLMQSDKVIRETIRNLGMSGTKAAAMRTSFELSSRSVAQMGGNLGDIQKIMEGYADETGRARVLSSQMAEDIASIGLGTGIGVEQATRLGAQFEFMGFNAKKTIDYVQGVVDTSERMGVNTTKVLKNLNDNFKKANTYSFKSGSKGIAEMAMNAEKFKVDMKDALSAADVAKSLEGAIDLAANLQIMGGEFAKTDPLEWMYLARNEPDKLTKKISEMTKGMVTFRKNSDGTFEKFISPADRQRLESVAKSLGISAEDMTQIAQRRGEMEKMNKELAGTGLTGREKELVQGAAVFNAKSGKFEVQLAGRMKDISSLTADQAKAFATEQVTLKDRAIAAQDFNTALKATIEEFKTILLPILRGVNSVLAAVRPIFSNIAKLVDGLTKTDFGTVLLKGAGVLLAAGFLINKALAGITGKGVAERIANRVTGTAGGGAGKTKGFGGWLNKIRTRGTSPAPAPNTGGGAAGGEGGFGAGAGVGAAALGIGAGIGLAALGISKLADAMSKLDVEKAKILQNIVLTLGGIMAVGIGAAIGIAAIGTASGAVAGPLMAFGGAVALIGLGIGVAAAGIGYMGKGLGEMFTAIKGSGDDFTKVAGGIGAMALAFGTSAVTLPAAIGLAFAIGRIAKHADGLVKVGDAFKQINAVMSGSKEDFIAVQNAVESISKVNIKGGGMLADLANLLKSPLKVEFAKDKVAIVSDITLNIDGEKFMEKVFKPHVAVQRQQSIKTSGY